MQIERIFPIFTAFVKQVTEFCDLWGDVKVPEFPVDRHERRMENLIADLIINDALHRPVKKKYPQKFQQLFLRALYKTAKGYKDRVIRDKWIIAMREASDYALTYFMQDHAPWRA
jgi:hypothetical protein